MIDLTAAGLTAKEAKCYAALLEKREWKPAELARSVNETRTNCYKILDNLVACKLAERFDKDKKLHYRAVNPARLLEMAREQRSSYEKAERVLENESRQLIQKFYKTQEQPGVRYFQGEKELKDIYMDQIEAKQPIYIIRPDYNMDIYDFSFMSDIRHLARKAAIPRFAITPDRPKAPKNYRESDPYMLLDRTWLPAGDYTAPVEWNAYGDKLAVMSFGQEAMGMLIESSQIAEAFRQLYQLLERGLRHRSDYEELPKHARYIGSVADKTSE
jgi:sugar-specific transcriptional regulator TrmB